MDNEKESQLIDLVQGKCVLWIKRLDDYRNKSKKERAWEEISTHLMIPVDRCQKTWNNLRSQFMAFRRKLKNPSGSGSETRPYFRHEQAMMFVHDSLEEEKQNFLYGRKRSWKGIHEKFGKKRKLDSFDEELLKVLKSNDEFSGFGNLVGMKLRRIHMENPKVCSDLKYEIQTLMHLAESKL